MEHKIAFNSANLVARAAGYKFLLNDWMKMDQLTRDKTDEKEWERICREVAAAGYQAIEIWIAHIAPENMTDQRAKSFSKILRDNGLEPIGLAGPLNDDTARVCKQLGMSACNGGLWGTDAATIKRLLATGMKFNYENHPEKTVDEIKGKITSFGDGAGIAVDTGWLGSQGQDASASIRALGKLIKHVHIKDVLHTGGHETCPLGEGIVNIPGVFKALQEIGYTGWYSWEDEPENRNPMDIAAAMRKYIEYQLA